MPKQKIVFSAIVVYIVAMLILPLSPTHEEQNLQIEQPEASVESGREDLQSRWAYEQQMLADPSTGKIPSNYRQREIEFSKGMNEKAVLSVRREGQNKQLTQDINWTSAGPNNFGGRTRAFALDVRDEQILLAGGVSGGMWKSENEGESWRKATTQSQIHSVSSITQDIRIGREDTWYYGTGELVGNSTRAPGAPFRGDGIFKSTDNGETWTQLASTAAETGTLFSSPLQYVWDITTDPSESDDVILAAIWGGIVRSEDGGETWATVLGNNLLELPGDIDLNEQRAIFYTDIHRTSNNEFYASLSSVTNSQELSPLGGVYFSEDGLTWQRVVNLNTSVNRRTEITSSPANPNIIYLFSDEARGYKLRRYNRQTNTTDDLSSNLPTDGGIGALNSQDSYNMVIAVDPSNENLILLGGTNLYRSTDGFISEENVEWIGGYDPIENDGTLYPNHHPDQHGLVFLPSNPNKVYSVNDGGVFISDDINDAEVQYRSLNNGFVTSQFYTGHVSQFPEDDFVFGGAQDNGTLLSVLSDAADIPGGTRPIGGDGSYGASTRFGIYYYFSAQNSRVFRVALNEDQQLTSFARVDPIGGGSDPNQTYLFINPYTLDATNNNRMYLAGGDVMWRNRNLSQIPAGSNSPTSTNWTRMEGTRIGTGVISALVTSTVPEDILYYGTSNGQLFKVTQASSTDFQTIEITGNFPLTGYIRSIAVDPTNADRVIVSFSNYGIQSLFLSEDGGESYTDISGNLEENIDGTGSGPSVRWVTIVPKVGGSFEYFVGTSVGLFSTTLLNGAATTWSQDGHEEIGNVVVNMIDYRRSDGLMMVATHGNGIFTTTLPDVLPIDDDGTGSLFEFNNAYPNPFQDFLTIDFTLPDTDFTLLRIYDSSGRMIFISSGSLGFTGDNEFFWDGTNTLGQPVPNGVYVVRLTYRGTSHARKVLLDR